MSSPVVERRALDLPARSSPASAPPDPLAALAKAHRAREMYHRAWLKLEQTFGADCRSRTTPRGERKKSPEADILKGEVEKAWKAAHGKTRKKPAPLSPLAAETLAMAQPVLTARDLLFAARTQAEEQMAEIAAHLTAYEWWVSQPGLGALSFAQIVAEAGDVGTYSCPGKLWARFGVGGPQHVAGSQRCKRRRTTLYRVGDAWAVKAKGDGRAIYERYKRYQQEQAEKNGIRILPQKQALKLRSGPDREECLSVLQVDLRARRYAEKRLLRSLWLVWRGMPANTLVDQVKP